MIPITPECSETTHKTPYDASSNRSRHNFILNHYYYFYPWVFPELINMKSQTLSVITTSQDARAKHSPLPWKPGDEDHDNNDEYSYFDIQDTTSCDIAMVTGAKDEDEGPNLIEAKANTDFICLAVNAHYDLLEACKFALTSPDDEEAIRKLEAAILKAQGK